MREVEYLAAWLWHEKQCSIKGINALLDICDSAVLEQTWETHDHLHLNLKLQDAIQAGKDVCERYAQKGITLLFKGSDTFPPQLGAFTDKMPILSVCGDVSLLKQRQIAIVGSRDINEEGRNLGELITSILLGRGFLVTSGGARGVDAVAHRVAMRMNAPTIVVTATDAAQVYPNENADIFAYAKSHGAVVSQFPMVTEPRRELFPSRNNVIAALSEATLIVQCRLDSGALYTANASLQLDRPVLVGATTGFCVRTEGGLELVKRGLARLVTSSEDFDFLGDGDCENRGIVRDLGLLPLFSDVGTTTVSDAKPRQESALRRKKAKNQKETQYVVLMDDPFWKQIYEVMTDVPIGRDKLSSLIGCSNISKLTEALIQMEFNGWIECIAGRYRKITSCKQKNL